MILSNETKTKLADALVPEVIRYLASQLETLEEPSQDLPQSRS